MRELVTTGMDVLGVLLLAAGVGFAVAALVGPAGVAASGLVLLAAVRLHDWLVSRDKAVRR